MNRDQVYAVLNKERDYQNGLNSGWDHQGKPTVEAELLMMEEYLHQARQAWVHSAMTSEPALNKLRSVVAMGIRCFENHGVPERTAFRQKASDASDR